MTHEAVLATVRKAQPVHLESVELFDVSPGRHVPEGFKSLAYAFTYRAADRTLRDEEVNAAQEARFGFQDCVEGKRPRVGPGPLRSRR